jgi:hypothetical protein
MQFVPKRTERSDTWITPKWIIDIIGLSDLDPCAYKNGALVKTAHESFTLDDGDDGLCLNWFGTIYCNPPFSEPEKWLIKGIEYYERTDQQVIFCLPCRTCSQWFSRVKKATGIVFFDRKIHFLDADGYDRGGASFPVCLVAFGFKAYERIRKISGIHVLLDV